MHPACLVKSIAGRDKDKLFVVLKRIDDNYVAIVDGNIRMIDKPKKKKIKHLKLMDVVLESISKKLKENDRISNSDIRKAIAEIKT